MKPFFTRMAVMIKEDGYPMPKVKNQEEALLAIADYVAWLRVSFQNEICKKEDKGKRRELK